MSKFKVGQVWESRDGYKFKVIRLEFGWSYPVRAVSVDAPDSHECSWTLKGEYFRGMSDERDLAKLVTDDTPEPVLEIGVATPVAYLWKYYQNDSMEVSGVTLTREFAEEVLKNEMPFGYKGSITPLYAGTTEEVQ